MSTMANSGGTPSSSRKNVSGVGERESVSVTASSVPAGRVVTLKLLVAIAGGGPRNFPVCDGLVMKRRTKRERTVIPVRRMTKQVLRLQTPMP
jgi:hypothetical protein